MNDQQKMEAVEAEAAAAAAVASTQYHALAIRPDYKQLQLQHQKQLTNVPVTDVTHFSIGSDSKVYHQPTSQKTVLTI